jgi:hypothetical protein
LNYVWTRSQTLAAQPLILHFIELQLASVLSLQRILADGNPHVIEVQEVRAFGVLLLHVLPVHTLTSTASGLDFSVRMIRSTCVPPALACEHSVFVDRNFPHDHQPLQDARFPFSLQSHVVFISGGHSLLARPNERRCYLCLSILIELLRLSLTRLPTDLVLRPAVVAGHSRSAKVLIPALRKSFLPLIAR